MFQLCSVLENQKTPECHALRESVIINNKDRTKKIIHFCWPSAVRSQEY